MVCGLRCTAAAECGKDQGFCEGALRGPGYLEASHDLYFLKVNRSTPQNKAELQTKNKGSFLGSILGSLKRNAANFFGARFHWNQNSLVISWVPGTMVMSGELVAFSNLCFTLASNDSRTPPLVLSETWTLALDSYQIHTPFHHPKKVTSRITQRIYTVQILFQFQGGIFSFYVGFRGCRCSFSVFPFFQQEVPRILEKLLHPRRCWCPVTIRCWDVAHWWRYIAPLCNTWRVTWWPEILRKKALETNPNGAAVCFCLVNHGY